MNFPRNITSILYTGLVSRMLGKFFVMLITNHSILEFIVRSLTELPCFCRVSQGIIIKNGQFANKVVNVVVFIFLAVINYMRYFLNTATNTFFSCFFRSYNQIKQIDDLHLHVIVLCTNKIL